MTPLIISSAPRPNRLTIPEEQKLEKYHADYGRFVAHSINNSKQSLYSDKYEMCMRFYRGDQWREQEDLATFFMDDIGETNNRIKAVRNYIQPMVEQYRGNARKMSFRHRIRNMSPGARNRKDEKLNRMLSLQYAASKSPMFKEWLKNANPAIGDSEEDTKKTFDTFYRDDFVKEGNRLLNASWSYMELDRFKQDFAQDIALAGIGIAMPYIRGGRQLVRRVIPNRFGWDRAAVDPRLKDSEYFCEYTTDLLTDIFEEHYDLPDYIRKALEDVSTRATSRGSGDNSNAFDISGRAHVYFSTWRDVIPVWTGYVVDEYGQVVMRRINFGYNGEETPTYTEADLLPVDKLTPYQKKVIGKRGANKVLIPCDTWRYCKFIPREYTAVSSKSIGDVVLDYGEMPYQEEDIFSPTSAVVPYKVGTWIYVDGEVISPVEATINPQRLANRFLSIMENQVNNSGGAGPVVDQDQLGNTDQADVTRRIKKGDPLFIHAKGMGVQNSVGYYDATIKNATLVLSNLVQDYKRGMEETTGVNEALKGQAGPEQLVGVMQLMMSKGSVIQEPFYGAIEDIYQGLTQSIVSVGRKLYTDNEELLHDMAGLDAVDTFKLSKGMRLEQLMVETIRVPDPELEKESANQLATQFLQMQMLDRTRFASLLGVSTIQDVYAAVRESVAEQALLEQMRAKQAEAQAQIGAMQEAAQGQAMQDEAMRQENVGREERQLDREAPIMKEVVKNNL